MPSYNSSWSTSNAAWGRLEKWKICCKGCDYKSKLRENSISSIYRIYSIDSRPGLKNHSKFVPNCRVNNEDKIFHCYARFRCDDCVYWGDTLMEVTNKIYSIAGDLAYIRKLFSNMAKYLYVLQPLSAISYGYISIWLFLSLIITRGPFFCSTYLWPF